MPCFELPCQSIRSEQRRAGAATRLNLRRGRAAALGLWDAPSIGPFLIGARVCS